MIRFKALIGEDSDDGSHSIISKQAATKEAQEAEAFALYNQALALLKQKKEQEAEELFLRLLTFSLLREAAPLSSKDEGLVHPGLVLKYSTFKNLASIAYQNNHYEPALNYYIEAVMVDATDVTVWYKIGIIALKLNNHVLAKFAFEQGLECSPRHWPCLDNVIPVLYSLNNYEVCLVYIAKALERDPGYVKGKAFLHKIFSEQSSLKTDSQDLFKKCDIEIYNKDEETKKGEKFVADALDMRKKRQELAKVPPVATVSFTQPLHDLTWKSLGDRLIALYHHVDKTVKNGQREYDPQRPRVSFGSKVDLSDYEAGKIALFKPKLMETPQISRAIIQEDVNPDLTPASPSTETTPSLSQCMSQADDMLTDVPLDTPMDTQTDAQMDVSQDVLPTGTDDGNISDGNMDTNTSLPFTEITPSHSSGSKRGRKRKFHPLGEGFSGKRRSARVRNTVTKKDEAVDFHELLGKFLPMSMLEIQEYEVDENSTVLEAMDTTASHHRNQEDIHSNHPKLKYLSTTEVSDLEGFLQGHQKNSGILELLNEFLLVLARKGHLLWPEGLGNIYMRAYTLLRKHFEYPDFLCKDVPDERIRDMALMALVYLELQLDVWISQKATTQDSSPKRSPGVVYPAIQVLGPDFPGKHTSQDLAYLNGLTVFKDIMSAVWLPFCARVYWAQARFLILKMDMEWAIDCFHRTEEYLSLTVDEDEEDRSPLVIRLPNCKNDNVINMKTVDKQLDSLKRCQSLEAVQKLHEAGSHDRVVELLLQTFVPTEMPEVNIRERHTQLLLLQDSLLQLKDYKRCIIWSEVSLHEAMKKYFAATSMIKQEWLATLCQLMEGINMSYSSSSQTYLAVPSKTVVRLTHNLTRLIQKAMDTPSSAHQMSIPTMLPWILLYMMIKNEEKKQGPIVARMDECMLPCSLILLNIAHEYLGRRSWCVRCGGHMLLFTVEALMKELSGATPDKPHAFREDIEMALEQCFYCLYSHPNRRTKAKHLEDHNVDPIPLTYPQAVPVFEYFKPKSMPEYDSYKTSTVSAELENLLRKISQTIPAQDNPVNTIESVTAYIEGASTQAPSWPEGQDLNMPIISELYYLLADYYFKNKEQMKAIKFYMLDLCTEPCRFDSWAGMALARASRLEQKLASHELKPEVSIQRQAICTLRCFKRALQLEDSNSKLWIEYGSIAYQLHSFASRQLKQKSWHPFTPEQLELAAANKTEMVRLAETSYKKAAEGESEEAEEQWLPLYMLGKVTEKMDMSPAVYLDHYTLASKYLHEDRAKYPKKITFYHSAPHLALESLELYYRLHVSILKYLLRHGDDPDLPLELFESYLKMAADGPFANCQELKRPDRKISEKSEFTDMRPDGASQDESDNAARTTIAMETSKKSVHKSMPDHTYSKQKLTSESSEQSSQESDSLNQSQDSSSVFSPGRPSTSGIDHPKTRSPSAGMGSPVLAMSLVSRKVMTSVPDSEHHTLTPNIAGLDILTPIPTQNITTPSAVVQTESGTSSTTILSHEADSHLVADRKERPSGDGKMETEPVTPVVGGSSMNENGTLPDSSLITPPPNIDNMDFETPVPCSLAQDKPPVMVLAQKAEADTTNHQSVMSTHKVTSSFSMDSILGVSTPTVRSATQRDVNNSYVSNISTDQVNQAPQCNLDIDQPHHSKDNAQSQLSMLNIDQLQQPELKTDQSQQGELNTDQSQDPPVLNKEEPMDLATTSSALTQSGMSPPRIHENMDSEGFTQASDSEKKDDSVDLLHEDKIPTHYNVLNVDGTDDEKKPQAENPAGSKTANIQVLPSGECTENTTGVEMTGREEVKLEPMNVDAPKNENIKQEVTTEEGTERVDLSRESVNQTHIEAAENTSADDQTKELQTKEENSEMTTTDKQVPAVHVMDNNATEDRAMSKVTEVKDGTKAKDITTSKESKCSKAASHEIQYKRVIEACMKALTLCLQRLPQHHKALYNLAYVYMNCPLFKNLEYAQDLLLGNPKWVELKHMPCPGMFHERKQNNFFQGLWKIPIEEIDRSGSFAAHLTASLELLFQVLEARRQNRTLYHCHLQLVRPPDTGKKYIRDSDRIYLANQAFDLCLKVLERKVTKATPITIPSNNDPGLTCLMEVHKVWQYGVKQRLQVKRMNKLLVSAYRVAKNIKSGDDAVILEQAIRFCQQQQQVQMATKSANQTNRPDDFEEYTHRKLSQDGATRYVSDGSTRLTSTSSRSDEMIGMPKPRTPEAMAKAKASEKLRQELLAKAKKVSRSPGGQKANRSPSTKVGQISPGKSRTTDDVVAQYQQQQQQQVDMMAALTQLYQQSGYSMAYAASLQAMTQSMYEGYSAFSLPASTSALDPTSATTMMQSAALAAASGMYPYSSYPLLNAEALAALSGTTTSTSHVRPGPVVKSPSAQRSPTSAKSPHPSPSPHGSKTSSPRQPQQGTSKAAISKTAGSGSHDKIKVSDILPSKTYIQATSGKTHGPTASGKTQPSVKHSTLTTKNQGQSSISVKPPSQTSVTTKALGHPTSSNKSPVQPSLSSTSHVPAGPSKIESHSSTTNIYGQGSLKTMSGQVKTSSSIKHLAKGSPSVSHFLPSTSQKMSVAVSHKSTPPQKTSQPPKSTNLPLPGKSKSSSTPPRPLIVPGVPRSPNWGLKAALLESPKSYTSGSSVTTPGRYSAVSESPGKDSILSLSSESQDVVIISSSQESDDDE